MAEHVTARAKAAIGGLVAKGLAWRDIAAHVQSLPTEAGTLKRALATRPFADSIDIYNAHGAAADGARDKHKSLAAYTAVNGFLVALIAGSILYVGEKPTESWRALGLTTLQVVFVLAALWSATLIMWVKPYRAWNKERSLAERQRIAHFNLVLSAREPAAPDELPYEALALEYVRAFLLDDQRQWFIKRARDFAPQLSWLRALRLVAIALMALAAVPAVLTVLASGPVDEIWPELPRFADRLAGYVSVERAALAGVLGGALQTLVMSLAATSLAGRNFSTYSRMAEQLTALSGPPLEVARQEAALGGREATARWWTELSFELAAENREWSAAHRMAQLTVLGQMPGGGPSSR